MTIDTKDERQKARAAALTGNLEFFERSHGRLCDEVDRLTASLAEQDAAAMAAIDEITKKASAMAIAAIKEASAHFGEQRAVIEAERDQLRAEIAEARKTVEALTRQVAALRAALISVDLKGGYVSDSRAFFRPVLADTATAAQGWFSEEEVRAHVIATGNAPVVADVWIAALKKARGA